MPTKPNNILFVFEGRKTEEVIVNSLLKHILNENQIVKCVFEAEIYQLYREMEADGYLDIFNLIKSRNKKNGEILKHYKRNDFAEVYLFFDYDAHSTLADDDHLREMLTFFDSETGSGKLYISYPMVEAVRHIVSFDQFKHSTAKCKGANCKNRANCPESDECKNSPSYKAIVATESISTLSNINGYTRETWMQLIAAHISKMNYVVNNIYKYPSRLESQLGIFVNQFNKYINKQCPNVAVLSAFPIFVLDYYGIVKTKKIIG